VITLSQGYSTLRRSYATRKGEEAELYERVKELWENEEAYIRFAAEPPFVEGAAERIWEYIQGLHERLARLL